MGVGTGNVGTRVLAFIVIFLCVDFVRWIAKPANKGLPSFNNFSSLAVGAVLGFLVLLALG